MIGPTLSNSWKPMDPRDSGIFRLASVGSYLDALSTITDEMSLKERLDALDRLKSQTSAAQKHFGLRITQLVSPGCGG